MRPLTVFGCSALQQQQLPPGAGSCPQLGAAAAEGGQQNLSSTETQSTQGSGKLVTRDRSPPQPQRETHTRNLTSVATLS